VKALNRLSSMGLYDFTVRARNRSAFTSAKSEILAGIGLKQARERRLDLTFSPTFVLSQQDH
jgi:tRNA(Ser,Leu) C12 N-acetylase TAN1